MQAPRFQWQHHCRRPLQCRHPPGPALAHTYPKRELVMQYGENDLQFISRLLAEIGIWFRFTADPKLNIDV